MKINEAIEFIKEKHSGQKRKQGTPYYLHPVQVSNMLKEKNFSKDYQLVGLFHDLLEDTDTKYEDIEKLTNREIAEAVKLLTKEQGYVMEEYIGRIKKNDLAKMVKIADRIHNLSEAHLASEKFQKDYIQESEKWFVDLAKNTVFERDFNNVLASLKKELEGQER